MNNANRTIDGENIFEGDIFNCNQDFEVAGFKGEVNQFLHKNNNNNALEWSNLHIADLISAGNLIDLSGSTISVDLSEAVQSTGISATDYIMLSLSNSTNSKILLSNLINSPLKIVNNKLKFLIS